MYLEKNMKFDLDSYKGRIRKHFVSLSLVSLKSEELSH